MLSGSTALKPLLAQPSIQPFTIAATAVRLAALYTSMRFSPQSPSIT